MKVPYIFYGRSHQDLQPDQDPHLQCLVIGTDYPIDDTTIELCAHKLVNSNTIGPAEWLNNLFAELRDLKLLTKERADMAMVAVGGAIQSCYFEGIQHALDAIVNLDEDQPTNHKVGFLN